MATRFVMPAALPDWPRLGFGAAPRVRLSDGSLLLYRCWGARSPGVGSRETGSGFFSLERPTSVLDAELRFNVVEFDNGLRFVSTFRLARGFGCWVGRVAHREGDLRRGGTQAYVEEPVREHLVLVRSREVLRQDVVVGSVDGHA